MCGFLFVKQAPPSGVTKESFGRALERQAWRGPDSIRIIALDNGNTLIGHTRLAIIDPVSRSDQPMTSKDGRYLIAFNGEIYNHLELRDCLGLECVTNSDTETVLEGYSKVGISIVDMLEGMFAFVIYDKLSGEWYTARDRFGIKPLYVFESSDIVAIGSEPAPIAELLGLSVDFQSVTEWRIGRRPVPGFSFFSNLREQLPATYRFSREDSATQYWFLESSSSDYEQSTFEKLLADSVKSHELSDVSNVALLSGGLDSAVITALSGVTKAYTVGLDSNNEIAEARETARCLGRALDDVVVSEEEMVDTWRFLTRLRGEPIAVPNEALIYSVCKRMSVNEKVVLTGEGADELLFGYDGIFRWALSGEWNGVDEFLARYGYSNAVNPTDRLVEFVEMERNGKSLIEFVEDFFYRFHLPGLLRRMDFASMAASKEARVPFVDRALVSYMYRRPSVLKISNSESKIPLRVLAKKLGLYGALSRRKIGFSATANINSSRFDEYKKFQDIVLGELKW